MNCCNDWGPCTHGPDCPERATPPNTGAHRHTCQQLDVCQGRTPACDKTCEQAEHDSALEPLPYAEGCQCLLAKVVILVLGVALGGVAGLHLLSRIAP